MRRLRPLVNALKIVSVLCGERGAGFPDFFDDGVVHSPSVTCCLPFCAGRSLAVGLSRFLRSCSPGDGLFALLTLHGVLADAMKVEVELRGEGLSCRSDFLNNRILHAGRWSRASGVQMMGM